MLSASTFNNFIRLKRFAITNLFLILFGFIDVSFKLVFTLLLGKLEGGGRRALLIAFDCFIGTLLYVLLSVFEIQLGLNALVDGNCFLGYLRLMTCVELCPLFIVPCLLNGVLFLLCFYPAKVLAAFLSTLKDLGGTHLSYGAVVFKVSVLQ